MPNDPNDPNEEVVTEEESEIPTIIGRHKRAFSTDTKGANQDIYTGIAPIDNALGGMYKSMGDLAGEV